MDKNIILKPWQGEFIQSSIRYPAMVSAWGTGKTMCGIFKGVKLSEQYPKNLGIVLRKQFTDLRDSTIKDFEKYTGLAVNSSREVRFDNGSIIMFRHLEEINNLQNVNAGWFLIEQAEELDTDQEFTMLRGRLRREHVQHCGMIIANTKGHNWIYKNWKLGNLANSFLIEAKTSDNADNLPKDYLADLELMKTNKPKVYARFVMNSWDEEDVTDVVITPDLVQKSTQRSIQLSQPIKRVVSIDVARYGDDKTIFYALANNKQIGKEEHEKKDTMEVVGRAILFAEKHSIKSFAVDEIGVGGGVADRLKELGKEVIFVNASKKSNDPEKYYNVRAEIYSYGAKCFQEGNVQVEVTDTDLQEQLSWSKYKVIKSNGLFQIESKDDIKQRYGRSPDNADAFLNGLWALQFVKTFNNQVIDNRNSEWKKGNYVPKTYFETVAAR